MGFLNLHRSHVVTFEAGALKLDALVNDVRAKLVANRSADQSNFCLDGGQWGGDGDKAWGNGGEGNGR